MKNLALLRHAKSSWDHSELADIHRPLSKRGWHDAPLIGQWIMDQLDLDLALISPARRAQETYEATGIPTPSQTISAFYPTNPNTVLDTLKTQNNDFASVMIVGHNPGISASVEGLLEEANIDEKLRDMPTCACAILEFPIDNWRDLQFNQARLSAFIYPKAL